LSRSSTTYPISSVIVQNGGGGLTQKPVATAQSVYQRAYSGSYSGTNADLKNLGILAPIQIVSGGAGYVVNDRINILGGTGAGAYANVITVSGTGAITSVSYVNPPGSNTANILDTQNIYISAMNNSGASYYSNRELAIASIGSGLTGTEEANFYTRVQTYQTALSRQVI
jgi:hypothetical protein